MIFNKIKHIELPQQAQVGEGFSVTMITDGVVPFGQVIIRQHDNGQWIVRDPIKQQNYHYQFQIPAEAYKVGRAYLQIEGCRVADITTANPDDWIKSYHELDIIAAPEQFVEPTMTLSESQQPVIYFGI
ncbi:MAG: hypothetical protein SVR94_13835, partial [Pseudomonadota bacterium]|nr:hypothetical protein [Pseudomonadota bacterium]